jgi:hypothetical protein
VVKEAKSIRVPDKGTSGRFEKNLEFFHPFKMAPTKSLKAYYFLSVFRNV